MFLTDGLFCQSPDDAAAAAPPTANLPLQSLVPAMRPASRWLCFFWNVSVEERCAHLSGAFDANFIMPCCIPVTHTEAA